MRHFESLSRKLRDLQDRQSEREKGLKIFKTQSHLGVSQQHLTLSNQSLDENANLKRQLDEKNTQILQFRCELDSLLDMLKVLHKQGVVIPSTTH